MREPPPDATPDEWADWMTSWVAYEERLVMLRRVAWLESVLNGIFSDEPIVFRFQRQEPR